MENEQKIDKIEKASGQTLPDDFKVLTVHPAPLNGNIAEKWRLAHIF